MRVKIRRGVFETNSSSSHSFTISKTGKYKNTLIQRNVNAITLSTGEFGWDEETFTDCETKASYLATAVETYFPQYRTYLVDVIKEVTGTEAVIIEGDGYIDHQSEEVARDILNDKEKIKDFIFNPKSKLVIDNDNH